MSGETIYLDHAATTPLRPEVLEAMMPFLSTAYGNPSSLHRVGREAEKAMKKARQSVLKVLNASACGDLVFTSGGTEANNLAIKGIAFGARHRGRHIITSSVEHPAVLEPCAWLQSEGWDVTYLPVDSEGRVNPADLEQAIRPDTVLISVMHGNNEVGTLQPVEALGWIARHHQIPFHVDAVQTVGKLPLDLQAMPVDLLSCSGHKLYGPKGIGFLYIRQEWQATILPWLHGGGQEGNLRSGTQHVAGIVGLATALSLLEAERDSCLEGMYQLQETLFRGILEQVPQALVNGPRHVRERVPGNVNVSFSPVEGEALVLRFDLEGMCVSSGSACHSGQLQGSHVLMAMGKTEAEAKSSVRFALGYATTVQHVEKVLEALPRVLKKVGYFRNSPTAVTME